MFACDEVQQSQGVMLSRVVVCVRLSTCSSTTPNMTSSADHTPQREVSWSRAECKSYCAPPCLASCCPVVHLPDEVFSSHLIPSSLGCWFAQSNRQRLVSLI